MVKTIYWYEYKIKKRSKKWFCKKFLYANSVFGKIIENERNYRDINLVAIDKRRKQLVSETNYHTQKPFSEYLMAIEMKKTKVNMTKPIYLHMSILDIIKILM